MSTAQGKEYWSETYAFGQRSIYAYERPDRAHAVYVKYTDDRLSGRDRRRKEKLGGGITVRNARGGIDRARVRAVGEAVERLAAELKIGRKDETREESPLALSEGFALALDLDGGKYPTRSPRWEEVNRARTKLERLLGGRTPWAKIASSDVRKVWRTLADEAARKAGSGGKVKGARQAEVTVDAFYSVAAWLEEEGQLESGTVVPIKQWRTKLKADWQKKTGHVVQPARLRHTAEEWTSILAALAHPEVDPRFRLLLDLGAEQRLGQVLRCMRSDLELPVVDATRAQHGDVGQLRVRGEGKKRTVPIALTIDQRAAVEAALSGYLADYEEVYREGKLSDYPLFPAERLRSGKAKVSGSPKHLTRDAARTMFRTVEEIAGVAHVEGRGWYGMRRVATDLAEDLESDERVLNSLSAHTDSATRRGIYQDPDHKDTRRKTAKLRDRLRHLTGRDGTDDRTVPIRLEAAGS